MENFDASPPVPPMARMPRPSGPGPASPAPCKLAATGACLVPGLCRNPKTAVASRANGGRPPSPAGGVTRRIVHRGQSLYRAGDAFANLYQLYAGSMKLRITNSAGMEQIASFPIAGALLGLDGIDTGHYACDAIALEDSLTCILPFADLVARSRADAPSALQLSRAIAQETNHYRRLIMVLAGMNSEERVAHFLQDISERMAASGYSSREFVLKMTRADIARYLGMKIETVSRAFTRLHLARILDVRGRHLRIRDPDALRRLGAGR